MASGGALNLALDEPGDAMILNNGGSPTITVDSGGTLTKTGGTGTSTIQGVDAQRQVPWRPRPGP